jgi:hypothetical protein
LHIALVLDVGRGGALPRDSMVRRVA